MVSLPRAQCIRTATPTILRVPCNLSFPSFFFCILTTRTVHFACLPRVRSRSITFPGFRGSVYSLHSITRFHNNPKQFNYYNNISAREDLGNTGPALSIYIYIFIYYIIRAAISRFKYGRSVAVDDGVCVQSVARTGQNDTCAIGLTEGRRIKSGPNNGRVPSFSVAQNVLILIRSIF